MANARRWQEAIQLGFQVFPQGGSEEFGAVRDVCPSGRDELLVYVENGGDRCIPLEAITDVHDEKVFVDLSLLPDDVRRLVGHAHDAEVPGL
jgi:hypothetical protein